MHTKSTFGIETRDRIADAFLEHIIRTLLQSNGEGHELLSEILRDGFDGLRHMSEQEVFRIAMMTGFFDEDASK
jgi:hypothetical protein